MLSDALNALRIALCSHQRQLTELDLIQDAETIVRDAYSQELLANVDNVLRQLDIQAEHVAWVRTGNDLIALIEGEQSLCGLQHLADAVLTQQARHAEAARHAETDYRSTRRAIVRRIEALQAAFEAHRQVSRP